MSKQKLNLLQFAASNVTQTRTRARLSNDTGRSVKTLAADLTEKEDLVHVEQVLRSDESINILINNAGVGAPAQLLDSEIERLTRMIDLNVSVLVRLKIFTLAKFPTTSSTLRMF